MHLLSELYRLFRDKLNRLYSLFSKKNILIKYITMDDIIRKNKPNISASTLKTYLSLLRSLYYKQHEKDSEINTRWFNKQDEIIKLLQDKPAASRKTTFAALIAICDEDCVDKYKKALMADSKTYDTFISTQEKSDAQKENWKSFDEVKEKYATMEAKFKYLLNSKAPLDKKDLLTLQDFIILSLTSGVWIPPRRSTDWIAFKIKDINKEDDNYMDKNMFHFNKYKTAKYYNEQTIEIPKGLKAILTKWIKLNPYDYLLFNNEGKQLTNTRLTQKLNKIFDGLKLSTSMLRHIYLTDKYKDIPALNELKKTASEMSHSVAEALEYIKH
jgi:hypothetical protein